MSIKFPAVIDSTIIKSWISCPRRCFHEHFEGLRVHHDTKSVDLVAGGAMAAGLEAARNAFYFKGASSETAIEEGQIALGIAYGADRPEEKKNLPRVRMAFEKYFERWPLAFEGGITPIEDGVEKSFAVPLDDDLRNPETGEIILYAGRCDMVGSSSVDISCFGFDEQNLGLFAVDEKTTGTINSMFFDKYDLDPQMIGYVWALRASGIEVDGIIVRGIGLTNRKVFDILQDFKEIIVKPSPEIISDWFKMAKKIVSEMIVCYKDGQFSQNLGDACHNYMRQCNYKPICLHLKSIPDYVEERWNPLERK
jgi:hypothetical protein